MDNFWRNEENFERKKRSPTNSIIPGLAGYAPGGWPGGYFVGTVLLNLQKGKKNCIEMKPTSFCRKFCVDSIFEGIKKICWENFEKIDIFFKFVIKAHKTRHKSQNYILSNRMKRVFRLICLQVYSVCIFLSKK